MYFDFANVLVYLLIAAGFATGSLVLGWVLRPNRPTPEKLTTYECGEDPIGSAWIQFNVRFYIIALIFLIFDVEVAVLFPWVTVFQKAGFGLIALVEILVFVAILAVGFVYVWAKGDLDWLKSLGEVRTGPSTEDRA